MKSRINKIINWQGKEYAHIVENEPFEFCDICAFGDLCQKVLSKEIDYNNSPMIICDELSKETNDDFSFFIEANKAENYCNNRNK